MVELSTICSPVTGRTFVTNNTNSPNSSVSGSDRTNTNDSQTYTTTNSSNRNILLTTKQYDNDNLENNIVKHVKEKAFRKFKFPPEITFVKATIFKIVKQANNNEIPNTIDIKDQKWSGIYCRAVTACRHNAQTLARKNYKDDKRNNQIPDSFPGTVLITDTQDVNSENRYQLHKDYRRKNSPEFKYFMKRILGAVSPKQTDFKRKSVRMTISTIFTPSDEAFALLFLYNGYDSNEGQDLYEYLVSELEERREEQQSKELETEILKMYQKQNGNRKQQDKEENTEGKTRKRKQHAAVAKHQTTKFNLEPTPTLESGTYLFVQTKPGELSAMVCLPEEACHTFNQWETVFRTLLTAFKDSTGDKTLSPSNAQDVLEASKHRACPISLLLEPDAKQAKLDFIKTKLPTAKALEPMNLWHSIQREELSGYDSPKAVLLVMKSFQYAVPEVFTGGKISPDPMILLAIPLWTFFEGEGSMDGFRYKLQTGLEDVVETIRQEAAINISMEGQALAQMSIFEHLHKARKVRAKLGVDKSVIMWGCLQRQQVALEFTHGSFSSHLVVQIVLNEHVRHQAIMGDVLNTHLEALKREHKDVMKELLPLKSRVNKAPKKAWLPPLGLKRVKVTLEKATKIARYVELHANTLWLNSQFDVPSSGPEDPPWTKLDVVGDTTTGQLEFHPKTMWEWDKLHMVLNITASEGNLSRGKKQKQPPNLHDGIVLPGWKSGSTQFFHGKLGGVTDGNKSIDVILPPAIQTTLHQILSSRAHNNNFVAKPKPQQKDKDIPPTPEWHVDPRLGPRWSRMAPGE
eukprot:jgi/Psemu1/48351/gm1.48351_g